jgi:cell division protein FtsA
MAQEDIVVGLDIGTTKVCAVIGERDDSGQIRILGMGRAPSEGLRAGVVVNIESTLRSLTQAIEAAEQEAGREVRSVNIGIAGSHVEGINSRGVVAISSRGREITTNDVARVMEAARAIVLPADRDIIHVIPQEYTVDSTVGVRNPIDMIGVRLEAEVHVISASITAAHNLVKCVNRAGFEVENISLAALAAGNVVLSADEKQMGCLFIEIGGGTADVILYRGGAPIYTTVIGLGGMAVSSDISIILKTTIENAEQLKLAYGSAWLEILEDADEPALLPGFLGRSPIKVSRRELCEFIQPRMAEIFMMIKHKIEKECKLGSWGVLGAGVVLSGGGAMLAGTAELAADIFGIGAHIGTPLHLHGMSGEIQRPDMATAVGLMYEAGKALNDSLLPQQGAERKSQNNNWFKKLFSNIF